MKQIKPNIYYFYEQGEILTAVDAYTMEVALKNFYRQGFDHYDHVTCYNGTFKTYEENVLKGDIVTTYVAD